MKKVFLLSGKSQRFLDQGFPIKPLIDLGPGQVIDFNVQMVDEDLDDMYFIVKRSDKQNYNITEVILNKWPKATVLPIDDHADGPVHSVLCALKNIPEDPEGFLFIYNDLWIPDFNMQVFRQYVNVLKSSEGVIVYHTGFHPHTAYNKSFCHLKMADSMVVDVREKGSFTYTPINEPSSSGIYYFRSKEIVSTYFKRLVDAGVRINNEFYITMVYNLLLDDKKLVLGYPVTKYISFGVPEDILIFKYYYEIFS